ncbi:aldehyde dehydrogenase family protein [bacterium]|nr:aldehyde dehydrogenase family protein [bacterium]
MPEPKHFKNYIGGQWVESATGERYENRNPANTDDLIGTFCKSDARDVDAAVAAAAEAFKTWRLVPAPERGLMIMKASQILARRKEEVSQMMTREMGKVIAETRGDTQEAIDCGYYAAGEGRRLFGKHTPVEMPNKFGVAIRRPVGVCGMITPWNFPIAIPSWKMFPALIAGNTCVIKPATLTPASVANFMEVFEEAGFPPGVVNMVTGGGSVVGKAMVEHPGINRISFTGSVEIGNLLGSQCATAGKPFSAELGGKNGQIVMDDANLELAVEGALWGAFGTTGQRCTATSRLILHEKIHDEFMGMLLDRAKKLTVGNGLDEKNQVGPTVSEDQMKTDLYYIDVAKNEDKSKLVFGGKRLTGGDYDKGYFVEPTIFTEVTPKMRLAQEEVFGPVLAVLKVSSFEEAIEVLNDTEFGLSSSIYTENVNLAFKAIRDIEAGITYVNGPTIGAEVHLPFGGVKGTGNGHREAGWTVLDFYTEWKSVYVEYSGKLQRAQIDNK